MIKTAFSIQELFALCRGKMVIAYGTGKAGKGIIPCLAKKSDIHLCGVTNSKITAEDAGTFLDTGLPIRSIQAWKKKEPDAMVLITTTRLDYQREIGSICMECGFQEIVFLFEAVANDLLFEELRSRIPLRTLAMIEFLLPKIDTHLLHCMCQANEIRDIHTASFAEFKGCHRGKTTVLLATGPSLNYYSQIRGVPHIGVNKAFLKSDIKLDYYFTADYASRAEWFRQLKDYDCIKFLGLAGEGDSRDLFRIPESIISENNARKFYLQADNKKINIDIEHYPLMGGGIIFAALHFLLYTMPDRILLIGCDCSDAGYFDGGTTVASNQFGSWQAAKRFVDRYYPDIEIISINPIGLKGMFRDMYTKSYLEANPEVEQAKYEILNIAD